MYPKTKEIRNLIFNWMKWNAIGWREELIEKFLVVQLSQKREER
jgi:hypothetical protein